MDGFGNHNLATSIKAMIACQPNFINQKMLMQHFCELLGAKSDQTPVAHCEIAGEGIKFDWGYSKMLYRSKPISMKRNKIKQQKTLLVFYSGKLTFPLPARTRAGEGLFAAIRDVADVQSVDVGCSFRMV